MKRLLPHLARATGTAGAGAAGIATAVVDACTGMVWGTGDGLIDAVAALQCAPPPAEVAAFVAVGTDAVGVIRPVGAMGAAWGALDVDAAGNIRGRLRLYEPEGARGASRMLVPAAKGPGPAVLSSTSALGHFRVRARDGIDIAAIAGGGQGAELFALDSSLFSGAVLDGTWELAIYSSTTDNVFPPAALAVGLRSRVVGEAAVGEFLAALRRRWPIDDVTRTWG
ncbi:MAG TPA: hypothetical protein VGF99_00080, partial [Myxococcota bacterium]